MKRKTIKRRKLRPENLGALAKQFAFASNPTEAQRLKDRIVGGFYGSGIPAARPNLAEAIRKRLAPLRGVELSVSRREAVRRPPKLTK